MIARSYVDQGRSVRDTGTERGTMLVHSENEWRERARARQRAEMPRRIGKNAALYLLMTAAILLITYQGEGPNAVLFRNLALVGVTVAFAFPTVLAVHNIQRMIDTGPVPGLYELGLQQSVHGFIPYSEIESTQRRHFDREGRTLLLMYPRHERRDGRTRPHREPWAIDVGFLGEEGARELERRVQGEGSPE